MKKIGILLFAVLVNSMSVFGQGARNIKINEIMTNNISSIQDEYGRRDVWVELANSSYSTYNVRGMFITTDRRALNKDLTVSQRKALMSIVPNGDPRTNMSARQHLVFFLNSNPTQGSLYITAKAESGKPLWVALYDGNAIDIIDSVSEKRRPSWLWYSCIVNGHCILLLSFTFCVLPLVRYVYVTQADFEESKQVTTY